MKTNLLHTCMVTALAATAALAQDSTLAKATVPFDFFVGNQTLPAGQYTMSRGPANCTVTIRSDDGKRTAIVMTNGVSALVTHDSGKLVFHRYGRAYFLSEIWAPGNDGRQLSPSRQERELVARMATPTNTTIAALR